EDPAPQLPDGGAGARHQHDVLHDCILEAPCAAAKIARHILAEVAFKHLLSGRRGTVATITINRPDERNALSTETVGELREALAQAKGEPQVRVIVITGAGKVFSAGADLNSFRREQPELERYVQRRQLADLFLEMTELGQPTV